MHLKLRDVDAQAVDLLLDRVVMARQSTALSAHGVGDAAVSSDRISAVERVLGMLDAMTPADPSSDLLNRTLARIEGHIDAPLRAPAAVIESNRPHA